jgi:RimJ/RimL family protein N-acetyltransferase
LADAEQIQVLFPQWEIVRYLAAQVPWPYPADGALHFIRDLALPAIERGEAWHWTLRSKSSPAQIIGSIDLRKKENDNRGLWLGLAWQRQGLMSEACEAVTDFWFNTLGFPVLRAPKAIGNAASRRISEKQGMRLVAVLDCCRTLLVFQASIKSQETDETFSYPTRSTLVGKFSTDPQL